MLSCITLLNCLAGLKHVTALHTLWDMGQCFISYILVHHIVHYILHYTALLLSRTQTLHYTLSIAFDAGSAVQYKHRTVH